MFAEWLDCPICLLLLSKASSHSWEKFSPGFLSSYSKGHANKWSLASPTSQAQKHPISIPSENERIFSTILETYVLKSH